MSRRSVLLVVLLMPFLALQVRADDPLHDSGRQVTDADYWAVKAIEKVRGEVVRDEHQEDRPVIEVALWGGDITKKLLKMVATCEQLQTLNLGNTTVADEDLRELAAFRNLRSLTLPYSVTDAGLKELVACRQLETLDLTNYGGVTDAGIKTLAGCDKLKALRLCRTRVTDEGVIALAARPQLRSLDLRFLPITDASFKALASCQELQALEVTRALRSRTPV
jgi:Leucine Rich repeat